MPKQQTKAELLRTALDDAIESGTTFRDLERETGVIRQSLMPFARGDCTLRLDKADALAKYFRLELQPAKRKESA